MKKPTSTSASPWMIAVFVCGLVVCGAVYIFMNRGYGKVSYPAYQVATALYGACLAKSEPRVIAVQRLLEKGTDGFDAQAISPQERDWLKSIIQKAQRNNWNSAAATAKRMMIDQNNRTR